MCSILFLRFGIHYHRNLAAEPGLELIFLLDEAFLTQMLSFE